MKSGPPRNGMPSCGATVDSPASTLPVRQNESFSHGQPGAPSFARAPPSPHAGHLLFARK